MAEPDKWSRWLAETRFGGDRKAAEAQMQMLTRIRDHLLKKAGLEEGKAVLDVGAGEGLIGFGALEKVGATGRVIFSDISETLVEFTRSAAEQMGSLDRCSFVKAGAEDLGAIESESIDVVTTRSVLIYVDDKPRAIGEFFRVLKPGGRAALFEPIDDHRMTQDFAFWRSRFWQAPGSESEPITALLKRQYEYWERSHVNDAMINFNERDLVRICIEAGFAGIYTEFFLSAGPAPPMNWNYFMKSSGNPLIPTNEQIWNEIYSEEERIRLEQYLRPLFERGGQSGRVQGSYTWAFKASIPAKPFPDDS